MSEFSCLDDEADPAAAAAPEERADEEDRENDAKLLLTITQTKYRCRHSEAPDVTSPAPADSPTRAASQSAQASQGGPASSSLWKTMCESASRQASANKEAVPSIPLQPHVVSIAGRVSGDVLDGFPLFSSGRLDKGFPYAFNGASGHPAESVPQLGGPQQRLGRCVRQSLFVFDHEDHVTAEALWRVIEFCSQQRAATLKAAAASLAAGRRPLPDSPHAQSEAHPASPLPAVGDRDGVSAQIPWSQEAAWPSRGPFAGAEEYAHRAGSRGDGFQRRGYEVAADVSRAPWQAPLNSLSGGSPRPVGSSDFEGWMSAESSLSRRSPLSQPSVYDAAWAPPPCGLPVSVEAPRAAPLSADDLARISAAAAALAAPLPAEQVLETYASCLLLAQPLSKVAQQQASQGGAREGGERARAAAGLACSGLSAEAACAALRALKEATGERVLRKLDEALLPACCCVAYRYDDPVLMTSCYWLLKQILLERGLPPEWREPPARPDAQPMGGVGDSGSTLHVDRSSPDSAAAPATHEQNGAALAAPGSTVDLSWLPPSVFQKCAGKKLCYSVARAVLTHLSYTVPLHSFWSVVADEAFIKSKFLEEPKGYLHCQFRRVRSVTASTYPHAYLLLVDTAFCRQLGLSERVVCHQESQKQVLLLSGRRQSEHSPVDFFVPFPALVGAAEPFLREDLEASARGSPVKGRGAAANPVALAASQKLLAVVSAARVHGEDYLGTLQGSFWGTKFSVTDWGLPQPYNHQLGASAVAQAEKHVYARLFRVYAGGRESAPAANGALHAARGDPTQSPLRCPDAFRRSASHASGASSERHRRPWESRDPAADRPQATGGSAKLKPVKYWELPYEETACGAQLDAEVASRKHPAQPKQMHWAKDCVFFASCQRSPTGVEAAEGEVVEVVSAQGNPAASREASATHTRNGGDKDTRVDGAEPISLLPHSQEKELCSIQFERNLRGDMPRQMKVRLNRQDGAYTLETVKAKWDESLQAYSLPFFGRAKVASAKNLQLIPCSGTRKRSSGMRHAGGQDGYSDDEEQSSIYLMMGKVSKDVFALDFRGPVRLFEAFAVAAAAMAKKRAVT
ncbi:hypothetical protein BESB_014090 [Besnoitia besnoiti]|uniref:Tubby C-terminal domain-containing protein n=1 Tax=Besnoitia besnoiti TaxID=94643 RepID=A0A2A9MAZ3_BESBE|nr:hypothetical protein BESB_014090 [Besnoitia besnoiti]PFH32797.1 hypothetical protein BESB_014090 [Besnoitia besnoiti]